MKRIVLFTLLLGVTIMFAWFFQGYSTEAAEIPRITFAGPGDLWVKVGYDSGNVIWEDTSYFYWQAAQMGATHISELHSRERFNHGWGVWTQYRAARGCSLGIYAHPDTVVVNGQTFNTLVAMYRQKLVDEFWNENGEWYSPLPDWFDFPRNNCKLENGYVTCDPDSNNPGYIFQNENVSEHALHYSRIYTVDLEVFKDDADSSDAPVFALIVNDPSIGNYPAINDTLVVRTRDLVSGDWMYFGKRYNNPFKANGYTRFSLYWFGTVKISFREMRVYDDCARFLDVDEDKPDYWAAMELEFRRVAFDFGFDPVYLPAFLVDEPWRGTWEFFSQVRDSIDCWMAENGSTITTTAVSSGLGRDLIRPYLQATGVPQLIYDSYPIKWSHWSGSQTIDADSVSIQNAWENLKDVSSPGRQGYFDHGGIRAACEESKLEGKDWWFCMQTSGACDKDTNDNWVLGGHREPTREEILCAGWMGITYGAKGFAYYHYSPFYSGGIWFADLPDSLDDWNGAPKRGLVDFWPDITDTTDTEINSQGDLNAAFAGNGWLHPNYKWYAVQEFDRMLDTLDNIIPYLEWQEAGCVAYEQDTSIGYVKINSCTDTDTVNIEDDSMFVEVGLFELFSRCGVISLVNRRCLPWEGRTIFGTITCSGDTLAVANFRSGEFLRLPIIAQHAQFSLDIPPGEGVLLMVMSSQRHDWWINEDVTWGEPDSEGNQFPIYLESQVTVDETATLTIYPGTKIIFGCDSSLIVKGKLRCLGKGDSTITFISMTADPQGCVELKGSDTDSLVCTV